MRWLTTGLSSPFAIREGVKSHDLIGLGPRAHQKSRRVAIRGNLGLRPATSIGKAGTGSNMATYTAPMSLPRRNKSPGEFPVCSASDGASLQHASLEAATAREMDENP